MQYPLLHSLPLARHQSYKAEIAEYRLRIAFCHGDSFTHHRLADRLADNMYKEPNPRQALTQAVTEYTTAMRLNPNDEDAYFELGEIMVNLLQKAVA